MDPNTKTEFPEFVDPIKESPVTGIVLGFDKAPTKFSDGKDVPIVTLEVGDVPRSLWLTYTVLKSQFARLRPEVGEVVRVEYLGSREGTSAEYHNFKVTAPERPP